MTFEETFKNWTLDQKVEWALGPNICNLSENMRSIIVDLKDENERLKADNEKLKKESDWLRNDIEQQGQRIDKLEETISNMETVHIGVDEIFHKANKNLSDVRFRKYYDNEVEWYYAEHELYILKFPNSTYFFVNARNPREAYCNYWKQLNKIHLSNPPTIIKEYK